MTIFILFCAVVLLGFAGCGAVERKLLFYPTHHTAMNGLSAWRDDAGALIGRAREVPQPKNVWLMLHGNGGQAADRAYALRRFSPADSVFILEYPGYGQRPGSPSRTSIDAAATAAFRLLQAKYPQTPVCVVGESLGTGASCVLGTLEKPPAKIVLLVPFDRLAAVAGDRFPSLLVRAILKSNWDNVAALSQYPGPVDIFAAKNDRVIPVTHAEALAASRPAARFVVIDGGHNDWSQSSRIEIRN